MDKDKEEDSKGETENTWTCDKCGETLDVRYTPNTIKIFHRLNDCPKAGRRVLFESDRIQILKENMPPVFRPGPSLPLPTLKAWTCPLCGKMATGVPRDHFQICQELSPLTKLAMQIVDDPANKTKGYDDLWLYFGLSYASWLTLPRVLMHEMPDEWQGKMAALLNEWQDTWDMSKLDYKTIVSLKKNNRFVKAPKWLTRYRHPDKATIDSVKRHHD